MTLVTYLDVDTSENHLMRASKPFSHTSNFNCFQDATAIGCESCLVRSWTSPFLCWRAKNDTPLKHHWVFELIVCLEAFRAVKKRQHVQRSTAFGTVIKTTQLEVNSKEIMEKSWRTYRENWRFMSLNQQVRHTHTPTNTHIKEAYFSLSLHIWCLQYRAHKTRKHLLHSHPLFT